MNSDALGEEGVADNLEPGFEPFNLEEERQNGFYDEDGEYHRKSKRERASARDNDDDDIDEKASVPNDEDDPEEPDEWVQSLDETNATPFLSKNIKVEESGVEADRSLADTVKKCRQLSLFFKSETESVLQVIKRLGSKSDPGANLSALNHVTELANDLLTAGVQDIYSYNKRMLQLEITDFEEELESDGVNREAMWRYKWVSSTAPSNQTFGPFSTSQMQDWITAGYFLNGAIAVQESGGETWTVVSDVASFPSFTP